MVNRSILATVFLPGSEAEHLTVTTLLRNAGIKYYSKNARVQNLFGAGQIGGTNLITGVIEIQVAPEDEGKAKNLINAGIDSSSIDELKEMDDETYPIAQAAVTRMINRSVVFSLFWLGGIGSILAIYYGAKALKLIKAEKDVIIKGKGKAIAGIIVGFIGVFLFTPLWFTTIFS